MLSLSLALWIFSRILLVGAYTLCVMVSGIIQTRFASWLGDSTPQEMGHGSINPVHHLEFFSLLFLALFGVAWPPTITMAPHGFSGRLRTLKLCMLYGMGPLCYAVLAFVALIAALYLVGPALSVDLTYLMHQAIYEPLRLQLAMEGMPGISSFGVIGVLFLAAVINLSIFMSAFSGILHLYRSILQIGIEKGYWYSKSWSYTLFGPLIAIIVLRPLLHHILFNGIMKTTPYIYLLLGGS